MTSTTQHFGLTKLDAGEGVHAGNDRFASDDRDTIDQALYNAVLHHHVGSGASTAPDTALDATLSSTGGTLPAGTTIRYKYTYTDPDTGETLASPETVVTTSSALTAPAAATYSLQSIGGTLEPGQYFYALSSYVGSSTVETKAENSTSVLIPSGTSTNEVTLTLPALDAGATGYNVYRRAPSEARYFFIGSTTGTEYIDGGDAATARSLPTANTTFATNSVTLALPGATPGVPAGNQWTIYRTFTTDYSSSFLVQLTDADVDYVDTGAATQSGRPPTISLGNPDPIDLTAEVQNELPLTNGGTGATTAAGARTNLGLGTMATQAASAVAITGGSVTGITDLAVADGGTGASTAATARTNLGLVIGTNVYGPGSTDVAIADGGTGASTAATARTNLGLGTIATQASTSVSITGGSITGITDLAIADGGTGASTAANARTNLGLGTIATQAASSVAITGGSVTGITDLAVADGGTGASDAATARTNLGAAAATDVTALLNLIRSGTGSPEGVVTADPGTLYLNASGGANTTLYVKESGTGTNTGWVAK